MFACRNNKQNCSLEHVAQQKWEILLLALNKFLFKRLAKVRRSCLLNFNEEFRWLRMKMNGIE